VVTSLALPGFEVVFVFPFEERFSGLGLEFGLIVWVGFAASDPVVASFSLAGFQVTLLGRFWVTPEVFASFRMCTCAWCS
jgi:hypothetical protein